MFTIDIEALARTGAQIRLGEIQDEIARLCGAFPDLCQPNPASTDKVTVPLTGLSARAAERGLTMKQYLAMRRNARRARQARRRLLHEQEIRTRLASLTGDGEGLRLQ